MSDRPSENRECLQGVACELVGLLEAADELGAAGTPSPAPVLVRIALGHARRLYTGLDSTNRT